MRLRETCDHTNDAANDRDRHGGPILIRPTFNPDFRAPHVREVRGNGRRIMQCYVMLPQLSQSRRGHRAVDIKPLLAFVYSSTVLVTNPLVSRWCTSLNNNNNMLASIKAVPELKSPPRRKRMTTAMAAAPPLLSPSRLINAQD